MKTYICLLVVLATVARVKCLTNGELYDVIKENASDFKEESDIFDSIEDVDDDSVITFPGGADDEVDMETLMKLINFVPVQGNQYKPNSKSVVTKPSLTWWHHHHHHEHHKIGTCKCRLLGCTCCFGKTYTVNLIFHKIHFTLKACVQVDYVPKHHKVKVIMTLNNRCVFDKMVSLTHMPKMCWGLPILKCFVRVCLEFYDLSLAKLSGCARLVGILDIKVHKFKVHYNLGCFKVPLLGEEETFARLLSDPDKWSIEVLPSGDDSSDDSSFQSDLTEAYRQLQMSDD